MALHVRNDLQGHRCARYARATTRRCHPRREATIKKERNKTLTARRPCGLGADSRGLPVSNPEPAVFWLLWDHSPAASRRSCTRCARGVLNSCSLTPSSAARALPSSKVHAGPSSLQQPPTSASLQAWVRLQSRRSECYLRKHLVRKTSGPPLAACRKSPDTRFRCSDLTTGRARPCALIRLFGVRSFY